MARIVFFSAPAFGHVNPTFRLARVARSLGHEVLYSSFPIVEDVIQAEGFPFVPIFERKLFPKEEGGWSYGQASGMPLLERLRYYRHMAVRDRRLNKTVLSGALERTLEELRPDLVLCDEQLLHLRVVAPGLGLPTYVLNTTFPAMRPAAPKPGLLNALRRRLRRGLTEAQHQVTGLLGMPSYVHVRRAVLSLARRYGHTLPPDRPHPLFLSHAGTSELVLCPREFLAPYDARAVGQCQYLGPGTDPERKEPAFPWERLEDGRPLVLLSPGTLAFGSPESQALFRLSRETAALRPDWRFVLNTGSVLPESLGETPPNLIAVQHAPQLALLKRAAAMVTHGGFNSVKECISFGVPMVALPQQADQFLVSSQVVRHQLGVRGELAGIQPRELLAKLDEVTTSLAVRGAMKAMRARFLEMDSEGFLASALGRLLPERYSPTSRSVAL